MRTAARRIVLALALLGLAASLASLYVHVRLLVNPSYSSFCDVNASVNCTQAYLSRYGSVLGIPVALPGALWFGSVLLLGFVERAGPSSLRESAPSYLLVSSLAATGAILYLGYAAFFVLRVACLLCLTTYAAVVGLLITSGLEAKIPVTTLHRRVLGDLRALSTHRTVLLGVVLFLAGAASAIAFFPSEASLRSSAGQQATATVSPELKAEFERWWEAQPHLPMPVSADGARVLIVKFTDLNCPYCAMSHFSMKPILARLEAQYPGAVRLVTKDYPLQAECNSSITRSSHVTSCDAAAAIRMARQTGKAEALEDWLYANQASLTNVSIRQAAFRVGGVVNFEALLPSAIAGVKTDAGLGRLLGIRYTPTFFINGVRCENKGEPLSPPFLEMAIALELRKTDVRK